MTSQTFLDQKEYLEIDAAEARDLAYEEYDGSLYEVVRTNHFVDEWRWGNTFELVIRDIAGNYWRAYYRESSGDGDWRTFDDGLAIVFTRVVPVEKTVVNYVDAKP